MNKALNIMQTLILDDQKSISRKLSRVPLAEMSPAPNCQSLMPSMESGGSSNCFGPHFNFYNCSVQFENMTSQAHNEVYQQPRKTKIRINFSDSKED